ncbi:enterophilin [Cystoisospora suis]|uniref:Enterophilin n=1 Tax=Cystoisospora suis TaxID=483139 RepID=A0A2C6KSY3_9APIC|nr:enterophilin [Cystoisospora suis]
MGPRPVLGSLGPQQEAPDPSLLYESPSNLRAQSRLQGENDEDGLPGGPTNAFPGSRGRDEEFQAGAWRSRTSSPRSLSADRGFSSIVRKNFSQHCPAVSPKQRQRFSSLFDDTASTESSSVDMQPADRRPVSAPNSFADSVESGGANTRRFLRKGSYDSTRIPNKQGRAASGSHRKVPVFYSESAAADMQRSWRGGARKAFPHLLQSTELGEENEETDTDEDLLHWKGWRELLVERQREMERHMCEERRELSKQDVQAECERPLFRRRKGPKSDAAVSDFMEAEEDGDPLGIKSRHAALPRGRGAPADASGFSKSDDIRSDIRNFVQPGRHPSSMAGPAPMPPGGAPPVSPFFGPFVAPSPYFPGWPPPYYAAAVAAAAAARKAGEKAGMTGQEAIQNLRKELEETRTEMKAKEEAVRKELEEEREKHKAEKETLEKQLGEARETAEQRSRELTGAELKHGELDKQIKMLRDEFDILSRVHNELKEQFEREKEAMAAEKNNLLTKVRDLENDLSFSKDQLLVARESLIAARTKQQAATDAHEEDLKALQEYRRENEALKEDVKYQRTLNLSLSEKVQRLLAGQLEAKDPRAGSRVQPHPSTAVEPKQHCRGPPRDQPSLQPPSSTLHQLFSPQVQQRLLKDRVEEGRGEHGTLKEATYTLPSTNHGSSSASFGQEAESIRESSLPSQSPRVSAFPYSEEHAVPRAHRLSSVEMRFLAHLHQSEPATTPAPSSSAGAATDERMSNPPRAWPSHCGLPQHGKVHIPTQSFDRVAGCRDSSSWLPPHAHPGLPNTSSVHAISRGSSSIEGVHAAASVHCLPRNLTHDRQSRPQQAGVQDGSLHSGETESEDQTHVLKGCKLRPEMQSRPPIFPPLPFADKIPTGGSTSRGRDGEVLRDPFPHMSYQRASTITSTMSSVTESGLPDSARPYVCRPGKPPPLQCGKPSNAEQSVRSPPGSTSPTSGLMSFPGSGGPSGLNSARTQWLLQRVSRISRLHGLQSIQDKLKDFPPAFLAASNAPARDSGNDEQRRLRSTDARENGLESSGKDKTARNGAALSTTGCKDSESGDAYSKRTAARGCDEVDSKMGSGDGRSRLSAEENPWRTVPDASQSGSIPGNSPTSEVKRPSSRPRSTLGEREASGSEISSRRSDTESYQSIHRYGRAEAVHIADV